MLIKIRGFTPVKSFPNYHVNCEGVVISTTRNRPPLRLKYGKINGYYTVSIYNDVRRNMSIPIHLLVARTFIPNPLNLPQVNHKDGNRLNSAKSNLEWVTCRENVLHGFRSNGRKQNTFRLTHQTFDELISLRFKGVSYRNIAKMSTGKYCQSHVHTILNNQEHYHNLLPKLEYTPINLNI